MPTSESIDLTDKSEDQVATGEKTFAILPRSKVYVADRLGSDWELQEYLYCKHLTTAAAPQIDECEIVYRYGPQIREPDSDGNMNEDDPQQYDPLDLIGKFVRVIIPDATDPGDGLDGGTDLAWYGIIETDGRDVQGSQSFSGGGQDTPAGDQTIIAHGLLRLLELQRVMTSTVNNPAVSLSSAPSNTTWEVGFGVPFNSFRKGERSSGKYETDGSTKGSPYLDRGNMSSDPDANGNFIFSEKPQRDNLWNAYEAAKYILFYNSPVDNNGDPICEWSLEADEASLSWYDVTVETDGKTVKQILDELITRRRGVSYFVTFNEDDVAASVNVFTFLDETIDLDVSTIAANPDQRSLDFESAYDVEVKLTNSISQKYDQVIAIGAFKTSTFTAYMLHEGNIIEPDWTTDDEDTYNDAAEADADYATLTPPQQKERNTRCRQKGRIRHVYRRFQINADWNQVVFDQDSPAINYAVAPKYNDDGTAVDGGKYTYGRTVIGDDTEQVWNRGLVIESHLPFKDRFDYSAFNIQTDTVSEDYDSSDADGEPQYIRPMFFTPTKNDAGVQRWEFLERLAEMSVFEDVGRKWSANVRILDERPAFDINVVGKPQHFIAPASFAGAAAFDPTDDPALEGGIDYVSFRCTITLRLQSRVQIEKTVDEDADIVPGQIKRILYIHVPDARLDYVVPTTVVDIDDGKLVKTLSGGFVRDDRQRLTDIATAAAVWYGRPRQTIEIKCKQIREIVKLGWLITDVGPAYQLTGVNTPITSISYDLANGRTTFQTAFADLEFAVQ